MLAWVPMNVIDAALEVFLVPNGVLPVSLLPDSSHRALPPRLGLRQFHSPALQPALREFLLDSPPACRVTSVADRQTPNGVEMTGQEHDRDELERVVFLNLRDGFVQRVTSRFFS